MEKKELIQGSPKKEEDAGRIINIVSHQLKRTIFFYTWKDCGLTTMQNRVLHYILARSLENPVYQKDIEKEFKVSKSTVTEILQLMEKNGFIIRKSSKRDGRMKRILPTEKAITIQKEVMDLHKSVYEKFGYEMEYIRPPKGEFSERTLHITKSLGYTTVMWSFAYDDWDENKQDRED